MTCFTIPSSRKQLTFPSISLFTSRYAESSDRLHPQPIFIKKVMRSSKKSEQVYALSPGCTVHFVQPVSNILGRETGKDLPTGWSTACGFICYESATCVFRPNKLNCYSITYRATQEKQILLLAQMHVFRERCSPKKVVYICSPQANWLLIHLWMPGQMLIHTAVWDTTRAKATVESISSHAWSGRKDASPDISSTQASREHEELRSLSLRPLATFRSFVKRKTVAGLPSAGLFRLRGFHQKTEMVRLLKDHRRASPR